MSNCGLASQALRDACVTLRDDKMIEYSPYPVGEGSRIVHDCKYPTSKQKVRQPIMATHEGKRSLEDIAATQAEHTLFLARIVDRLDEHTTLLNAIDTSLQLLAGNITNMRTELLVIKALVAKEGE